MNKRKGTSILEIRQKAKPAVYARRGFQAIAHLPEAQL